jgi:hypothetical protein
MISILYNISCNKVLNSALAAQKRYSFLKEKATPMEWLSTFTLHFLTDNTREKNGNRIVK